MWHSGRLMRADIKAHAEDIYNNKYNKQREKTRKMLNVL